MEKNGEGRGSKMSLSKGLRVTLNLDGTHGSQALTRRDHRSTRLRTNPKKKVLLHRIQRVMGQKRLRVRVRVKKESFLSERSSSETKAKPRSRSQGRISN